MSKCVVCGLELDRCPLTELPLPRDCLKMGPRRWRTSNIKAITGGAAPVVAGLVSVVDQIGALRGRAA